jgi:hypothetical protein
MSKGKVNSFSGSAQRGLEYRPRRRPNAPLLGPFPAGSANTAASQRFPRPPPESGNQQAVREQLKKPPPARPASLNSDPLAKGYIASLSHPGGNLTGVVFQQFELTAKRLDLLTQAVPRISRIVLLYDIAGVDQAEAAKRSGAGNSARTHQAAGRSL